MTSADPEDHGTSAVLRHRSCSWSYVVLQEGRKELGTRATFLCVRPPVGQPGIARRLLLIHFPFCGNKEASPSPAQKGLCG